MSNSEIYCVFCRENRHLEKNWFKMRRNTMTKNTIISNTSNTLANNCTIINHVYKPYTATASMPSSRAYRYSTLNSQPYRVFYSVFSCLYMIYICLGYTGYIQCITMGILGLGMLGIVALGGVPKVRAKIKKPLGTLGVISCLEVHAV